MVENRSAIATLVELNATSSESCSGLDILRDISSEIRSKISWDLFRRLIYLCPFKTNLVCANCSCDANRIVIVIVLLNVRRCLAGWTSREV